MNAVTRPWAFGEPGLLDALEAIPLAGIDEIGFGLIVMNRGGEVIGYNAGEDAPPERSDDVRELQDLREFFYQCPVGLFAVDDDGLVARVNPAAVAMLAPVIGSDNLTKLSPLLDRLAPQLIRAISQDRGRMGPLAAGPRILIPAQVQGTSSLEIRAVRAAPARVMVVLLDVSAQGAWPWSATGCSRRKRQPTRRPPPPATRRSPSRGRRPRPGSGCRPCRWSRPGSPRR